MGLSARKLAAIVVVPLLSVGVGGCSSSTPTATEPSPTVSASPTKETYPNNVIDIRNPEDFDASRLDQSVNLPYADEEIFSNVVAIMNKDLVYEFYGSSEEEVDEVVARLRRAGFTNVKNLGDINSASETTGLEIIQ